MRSLTKTKMINKHSRTIWIVLLALVFTITTFMLRSSSRTLSATALSANSTQQISGPIDGRLNPELIPDTVAYSLLFRFLSGRETEAEKDRLISYLRQSRINDADANILLVVAEEFQQQVSVLDRQAKEIKDRNWPNPGSDVMSQLTTLQQQKEQLIAGIVVSLAGRLTTGGVVKLQQLINGRFKSKIKLSPSPQSPPGGLGWQQHPSGHQHR